MFVKPARTDHLSFGSCRDRFLTGSPRKPFPGPGTYNPPPGKVPGEWGLKGKTTRFPRRGESDLGPGSYEVGTTLERRTHNRQAAKRFTPTKCSRW